MSVSNRFWTRVLRRRRTQVKTKLELQDDLSHAVRSAEDIQARADTANRGLSTEESKTIKELLADAESIKGDIAKIDADDALRASIVGLRQAVSTPGQRQTPTAPANNDGEVPASQVRVVPTGERIGGLKAFTAKNHGGDQSLANFNAYKSAMWFAATFYGHRRAIRWMQENVNREFRAAHSEGINTEGGYGVIEEMAQTVIDLREQYGVFRNYCKVRPMASDTLTIPRKAARFSASWTAEATALGQSQTAFDQVRLTVSKLGGYALISTELAEDFVVSIVDELTKDMGIALAYQEDLAGFTGDSTPTYGGITGLKNLFVAGTSAGAVDATTGHDTALEVDVADIMRLMGKLPDYAMANAKFFCSRQYAASIFGSLKASAGGNTIQTMEGNVWGDYLGVPIVISQVLPSTTSTINNEPMLYYGDLSMSSSLGERRGVQLRRSDEIKFLEDQIALKITERVDIVNHDVGDATNPGAIVALMGNT